MSSQTYNALSLGLVLGFWLALLLAIGFLIAAVVGWRGPHRKRRLVRFALCLVAMPLLVGLQQWLLWGVFLPSLGGERMREMRERSAARADAAASVRVGDRAPVFVLTDTQGRRFALEDQRGKVVLLNFFATWCGPCIKELPYVQKLWDEHRGNGKFALLVIGREETNDSIAAFQAKHDFSFPAASDPERAVYSLYAKELIPRTYLIAPDGTICFSTTGFYEEDLERLREELEQQLRSAPQK